MKHNIVKYLPVITIALLFLTLFVVTFSLQFIQTLKNNTVETLYYQNYSGKYIGVFLTSGNVFFGKFESENPEYIHISDVYFMQTELNPNTSEINPLGDLALSKLTSELYKPKDSMQIAVNQILFVQELDENSQVLKSITSD